MNGADLARARDQALAALTAVAEGDSQIEALWLQGSLARGDADDLSDIDACLAVRDETLSQVYGGREVLLGRIGRVLAWSDATVPGLKLVHALFAGGVRLDLTFEAASTVADQARPAVTVLFDRADVAGRLRLGWTAPVSAVGRAIGVIIRITRQGGTWPLRLIRRGQWSAFAMMELDLVNAQLAQLMAVQLDPALFYQNPLALHRRLTGVQRDGLDRLTAAVLDAQARRDYGAMLSAHLEVLDALVREGRAACAALGVAYPISATADAELRRLLREAWPA